MAELSIPFPIGQKSIELACPVELQEVCPLSYSIPSLVLHTFSRAQYLLSYSTGTKRSRTTSLNREYSNDIRGHRRATNMMIGQGRLMRGSGERLKIGCISEHGVSYIKQKLSYTKKKDKVVGKHKQPK
jgi:hypothetical protein